MPWKPGQSGNPSGRPRSALAFAEAIRARLDPHLVLALVERFIHDESVSVEKRLAALLPWMQAGYLRPPTTAAVTVEVRGSRLDWDSIPIGERIALLERLEAVPRLGDGTEPAAQTDDEPFIEVAEKTS